jgi:hypothetical protein
MDSLSQHSLEVAKPVYCKVALSLFQRLDAIATRSLLLVFEHRVPEK